MFDVGNGLILTIPILPPVGYADSPLIEGGIRGTAKAVPCSVSHILSDFTLLINIYLGKLMQHTLARF